MPSHTVLPAPVTPAATVSTPVLAPTPAPAAIAAANNNNNNDDPALAAPPAPAATTATVEELLLECIYCLGALACFREFTLSIFS